MASIHSRVLDNGLTVLDTEANVLHWCSAEPTSYALAVSLSLGSKTSLSIGAPAAHTNGGRKVTVAAVTNGLASANGTVTHYAVVDSVNSRLLAVQTVTTPKAVNNGDTITSPAFDIGIPGPT